MASVVAPDTREAVVPRHLNSARGWLYRAVFKSLFTYLGGITFGDWCRVLHDNQYAIEPRYWPRATVLTARSAINSLNRRREDRAFRSQLDKVTIQPPLFILGHWRSGTTLLHNLLALDDQFTYPNLYQVLHPHTFLTMEDTLAKLLAPLLPPTRIIDNVGQGIHMPNEDEFATSVASLCSPYMGYSFPCAQERYDRYLTFRGVPTAEVAAWQDALVTFMKKLTLKAARPIVLKSPPHTCRIRLLLGLFPAARFVHIRRNPYTVFQSTRHLNTIIMGAVQFQRFNPATVDDAIFARYNVMHEVFFEERGLIPAGQFHELAFEDLETDPIGQMRLVYDKLGLSRYDDIYHRLKQYVASLAGYRKNEYPALPGALRERIAREWRRTFDEWYYPLDGP